MSKIYALCDKELLDKFEISLDDFLKMAKYFDVDMIQYRDKISSIKEIEENIKYLKKSWTKKLIINDHIEMTQFCDGIHLGQEDLLNIVESFGLNSRYEAISYIRKIVGKKIIGISTHNKKEIQEANLLDIDYIGLGAYRISKTKDVNSVINENIDELIRLSKHPVAVIGGVRLYDNINSDYKVIGRDLFIKYLTYN